MKGINTFFFIIVVIVIIGGHFLLEYDKENKTDKGIFYELGRNFNKAIKDLEEGSKHYDKNINIKAQSDSTLTQPDIIVEEEEDKHSDFDTNFDLDPDKPF